MVQYSHFAKDIETLIENEELRNSIISLRFLNSSLQWIYELYYTFSQKTPNTSL